MGDTSDFTSIMHLPDDCLSFIFQRLDCSSDREAFGLTCHRWLNIQNVCRHSLQFQCSLSVLNILSLSQNSLEINYFHLYRLLTRFQHLRSLSLSGCTELPDSGLIQLLHFGSKLHSLYLDCCFGITNDGLSTVANGCPSLTVISLYRCTTTDSGLEILAGAGLPLKHVNLSYCSLISDSGLRVLSQGCRQLCTIKISLCRGITGIGLEGCSPILVYIDAELIKLEPGGIKAMVSGGGLEYLNVSGINGSITGAGLSAIGAGLATRLKTLNTRMLRMIGDESIVAIAKGCPLLQEWNLASCHEVRVSGWEAIGMHCHNLEILHVSRCRNLCDGGVRALRDGCKRLSVLYMRGNPLVSATAIELFRLQRIGVEIKKEDVLHIGPDWQFGA